MPVRFGSNTVYGSWSVRFVSVRVLRFSSVRGDTVKVNSFGGPERFNQRVEARFVVVGDSGDPGLELSPFQKEQTVA